MTQTEILKELARFSIPERLAVAEAALRLIRQDLEREGAALSLAEKKDS